MGLGGMLGGRMGGPGGRMGLRGLGRVLGGHDGGGGSNGRKGVSGLGGSWGWTCPAAPVPVPVASRCPQHVLRIHLLEAENLIAKDNFFKGVVRGRSDPYAKVRVAGKVFRSRVVKEDLNPRWNEVYEVPGGGVPAPRLPPPWASVLWAWMWCVGEGVLFPCLSPQEGKLRHGGWEGTQASGGVPTSAASPCPGDRG